MTALLTRENVESPPSERAPSPVLSVELTSAQTSLVPVQVTATGHVAAWQEAIIGSDTDGLRLIEVLVNVGDIVRQGQRLATFDAALLSADVAEAKAAVAVAEAEAAEAEANARRARALDGTGALSAQQVGQYLAAADSAQARLRAARVGEQRHRLRQSHTRVLAPSDGVITSRSATVGAVMSAGQELFRIIKDGRLEWRATVSEAELIGLVPGQVAQIQVPGHSPIPGIVRMVSPNIDTQTHSGLVYVDLLPDAGVRAGTFVSGVIVVGEVSATTLPQSAVLMRDGFHWVMQVDSDARVIARRVTVGRRIADRVEISEGLAASERVIAAGLSFIAAGDTVRVVDSIATSAVSPP